MTFPLSRAAALGCLLLALSAGDAAAQRRRQAATGPMEAGIRGSRDFDVDKWGVGAQARIPFGQRLELHPSADLYFLEGSKGWQANADGAIRFGPGGNLFAGGGLAIAELNFADDERKTGYNIFFGLALAKPEKRVKPFVEFRWSHIDDDVEGTDDTRFRLAAGLNWALGG
jgi:hypothetical protein